MPIEHDFPFHHVFGRADLAAQDAASKSGAPDRRIMLDGVTIATIPGWRKGYSASLQLPHRSEHNGSVIGPSFNHDVLRRRIISQLFEGDEAAFARAEIM